MSDSGSPPSDISSPVGNFEDDGGAGPSEGLCVNNDSSSVNSHPNVNDDSSSSSIQKRPCKKDVRTAETGDLYCSCRGPYEGKFIACDGEGCRIEWFHFDCVGIKVKPRGKWYCPDCKPIAKKPNAKKPKNRMNEKPSTTWLIRIAKNVDQFWKFIDILGLTSGYRFMMKRMVAFLYGWTRPIRFRIPKQAKYDPNVDEELRREWINYLFDFTPDKTSRIPLPLRCFVDWEELREEVTSPCTLEAMKIAISREELHDLVNDKPLSNKCRKELAVIYRELMDKVEEREKDY